MLAPHTGGGRPDEPDGLPDPREIVLRIVVVVGIICIFAAGFVAGHEYALHQVLEQIGSIK